MKRKSFIKRSLPVATLPFLINGLSFKAFGEGSAFEQMLEAATETDKVLVLIQLNGGNDGLNTVIPLDQYSPLSAARGNLLIDENLVLPLNGTTATGLHPSLTGLQNLYNNQQLAIVQGVSYPNPSFSHFRATDIWLTASDSSQTLNTGWVGRFLDQEYTGYPAGYPNTTNPDPLALQIGNVASPALQGPTVNMGIAITSSSNFYQLTSGNYDPAPNTPAGHELSFIRATSLQTQQYAAVIKTAAQAQANLSTLYPSAGTNSLADQLKIVAQLIGGGLKTRVYMVNLGGFDTHNSQVAATGGNHTGEHADLLKKISDAVAAFEDDITLMGQQDRVLGMTFSEFGRRIKSNASLGTDHGSALPVILFGSKVKGGLIGNNPTIPGSVTSADNLEMQYDFRSIYTSILKNWFCIPDAEISATMLQSFQTLDLFTTTCTTGVMETANDGGALRNYPNPANNTTIVEFETEGGNVEMKLYDEMGKELRTFLQGTYAPGTYRIELNTQQLQKGVYFYSLKQGNKKITRRLMVM